MRIINLIDTILLSLMISGCVTDHTPGGGIPTIGYQTLEGIDTISVGTTTDFTLRRPVLPQCQYGYTDLGTLVRIEFFRVELSLLDSSRSLSFVDSLYIDATSTTQRYQIASTKLDSLAGFVFTFQPVAPNYQLELCHLNQNTLQPAMRIRYRRAQASPIMLRVKLIFNIGRIDGYVA